MSAVYRCDAARSVLYHDWSLAAGTPENGVLRDSQLLSRPQEAEDAPICAGTLSWSGPVDGSMQDLKAPDGQVIGKESLKRDGDVVLRHYEVPNVGTFDSRVTISADGNTFTDVLTMKSQDGKTVTDTVVFHRVAGAKPATK